MSDGAHLFELKQLLKAWDFYQGQLHVCDKEFAKSAGQLPDKSEGRPLPDVESGQETLSLKGPMNCVRGVAFSSDGKRLAAVSHDHELTLWETIPLAERLSTEITA